MNVLHGLVTGSSMSSKRKFTQSPKLDAEGPTAMMLGMRSELGMELEGADGMEGEEEAGGDGSRKKAKLQNVNSEKRKEQNRAAQRAFRERKEKYVRELEEKMAILNAENKEMKDYIEDLENEVKALRQKMTLLQQQLNLPFNNSLPSPPPPLSSSSPSPSSPQISIAKSQPSLDIVEPKPPQTVIILNSLTSLQNIPDSNKGETTKPSPTLTTVISTSTSSVEIDDAINGEVGEGCGEEEVEILDSGLRLNVSSTPPPLDWDLDSISPSFLNLPLPSLFFSEPVTPLDPTDPSSFTNGTAQSSLGSNLKPNGSARSGSTADRAPDKFAEDDDADIVASEGRGLVCEKPGCNFDALSCALPSPWRPPPTMEGREENIVSCKRAWAKLASHPKFKLCNTDELCLELRSKAKCTPHGKLGIDKEDLWNVYRSVPERANAREYFQVD